MSSLYSSSLASFRTSCDVDNITKDYDSGKATFLSFLAVVQALKIDFLPMTWDAGRDDIGFGATSRVNETHINIHTSFALKRVNRHKSEEQIFRSCTKEITVLAHKSVREHPNIAQLQGICWDVSAFDDKPWPVLVFEKTHLGDLYEFAMLPAGRTMSFSQRLRLCMDMGRAIMDMHSMNIVHGDIKPDNVLVFTEESGQYKARVTDFGYSSRFTNDEDRLKLPISVPWNAPEVDRLNREWTPSQAKQADLFSFGMLCVWLVFETYFSGSTKPPADVQLPVFISSTAVEQTKLVLLQVKGKLQMYIPYLLAAEDNLDHQTIAALEKFLVSCLSKDPDERLAPIRELLEQLAPEKLGKLENPIDDADWQPKRTYFKLDRSILQLYQSDYRVRIHIAQRLTQAYQQDGSYSLQLAFCHLVGFGIPRSESQALQILHESNQTLPDLLELMIQDIQRSEPERPSILAKLVQLGTIDWTYFAHIYLEHNKVAEAESWLLREKDDLADFYGEHSSVATVPRYALAALYDMQNRWDDEEVLLLQLLETYRARQGEEGASTLNTMSNLASVYRSQGRWVDAEELETKVLELTIRLVGEEHFSTLCSLSNLAMTYRQQARWRKAEELDLLAAERGERLLGSEHPRVLIWKSNLAATYTHQGRLFAAEKIEMEVMKTREAVLGLEHPDTLSSMGNLAALYLRLGRWKEAEDLGERVVEISKRVMGESHPETLSRTANLAMIYEGTAQLSKAEGLEVEVMEARKRGLGSKHPLTLTSMNNLAVTYWRQGRLEDAAKLRAQEVQLSKEVLGGEHPGYLTSLGNLALIFEDQGRLEEAEELELQVMETRKRVLGAEHPQTLTSMSNLAGTWGRLGRHEEAVKMMEDCLKIREVVLGLEHPETKSCLFALDLFAKKRQEAAEPYYLR